MWADIVPLGEVPLPPTNHKTPHSRGGCELRVITWNVSTVCTYKPLGYTSFPSLRDVLYNDGIIALVHHLPINIFHYQY
jgi:hypothetical protein